LLAPWLSILPAFSGAASLKLPTAASITIARHDQRTGWHAAESHPRPDRLRRVARPSDLEAGLPDGLEVEDEPGQGGVCGEFAGVVEDFDPLVRLVDVDLALLRMYEPA
jgi:hypothetical protein